MEVCSESPPGWKADFFLFGWTIQRPFMSKCERKSFITTVGPVYTSPVDRPWVCRPCEQCPGSSCSPPPSIQSQPAVRTTSPPTSGSSASILFSLTSSLVRKERRTSLTLLLSSLSMYWSLSMAALPSTASLPPPWPGCWYRASTGRSWIQM